MATMMTICLILKAITINCMPLRYNFVDDDAIDPLNDVDNVDNNHPINNDMQAEVTCLP